MSGVSGRSELCSFHTVSFWTPSSSTLRRALTNTAEDEQSRERGREGGKKETNRQKRENSSVHSLQCDVISCLRSHKCVMFSVGLEFTLTSAGTSSAAAALEFVLVL